MAYRYPLTNEGINSGCEQIQSFIEHAEISNADRIKIPLLIEETLLQYQKLSGNGIDFALNLYKIMDAYKIDLRVNCDRLNPFIDANDEAQLLNEQILQFLFQEESYESTKTSCSYSGGTNRILITAKAARRRGHKIRIPDGANTVAVIAAILYGCLFAIVPETTSAFVLESIVQPVSSALLCLRSSCRSLGLIPKP